MFGRNEGAGGIDVRIERGRLSMPNVCALCERPAETRRLVPDGPGLYSMVSVPYCNACARLSRSPLARIAAAGLGTALIAMLAGAGFAALIELPIVWTAIGAVVAVTVVSAAAARLLWPRSSAIVSFRSVDAQSFILHCPNAAWGEKVAERSRATAVGRASTPRDRMSLIAIGVAAHAGIAAAYVAWRAVHARLVVDNTLEAPVLVWIDGEPSDLIVPNTERDVPPSIWIRVGEREIGHSRPGASAPERTAHADVSDDGVLYSPGGYACYWRAVDGYGRAAANVDPGGPLVPRTDLYSLRGVDSVFTENPRSVSTSSSRGGTVTRTALWPYVFCTELARAGCAAETIDGLLACADAATDEAAMDACELEAARACEESP